MQLLNFLISRYRHPKMPTFYHVVLDQEFVKERFSTLYGMIHHCHAAGGEIRSTLANISNKFTRAHSTRSDRMSVQGISRSIGIQVAAKTNATYRWC